MTRWLDIAWAEQGTAEVAGVGANPAIVNYFADAGRPDVTSDETAWCAAFVGACLARGGVAVVLPEGQELLARSFLKVGTAIDKVRPGCLCVVTRGDPKGWTAHVFFGVGETETHIIGLGGNQANAVTVAHFPKSQLLGMRWPEPAKAPGDLAESRIAAAAARQVKDAAKGGGAPYVPAPPVGTPKPPLDGLDALAGKATAFQGVFEALAGFAAFAGQKWPLIVAGVALYYGGRMAWDAWQIRQWRAEDASTGKTVA